MALLKKIELDNGVTVNYHRIASINNITNQTTLIEVVSYTSKSKREEEKNAIKNKTSMNVFNDVKRIEKEYTKELNVDTAYEYLKTLDTFSKCTDDL